MEEQTQDPLNNILSELGIRINETEEKQRLIKDRILLIGSNLVSIKEGYDKQFFELKKQIKTISEEIKTLKQLNERIINEINNFARKPELDALKRQSKIFDPLEFARMSDIREIVKEEIKKLK